MKSIQIAKLTLAIKNRFPTIADERLFSMIEAADASNCTEFVLWSEAEGAHDFPIIGSVTTRMGACSINAITYSNEQFYQSGRSEGMVYPAKGSLEPAKVVSNLNNPEYIAL